MRLFLRSLVALALIGGAAWQAEQLFEEWRTIPRKDFLAWRIEYASLNLEDGQQTHLKLQARAEKTSAFKNIAIPHLELLLTDSNEAALAAITLKPEQWLPKEAMRDNRILLEGIVGGTEITSTIPVRIPEHAAGYRVRVYYP